MNSPRKIVGTSIFYSLVVSTFGELLHFGLDIVRLNILASMLIGSIPGIFIGTKPNDKMPMKQLHLALFPLIFVSAI